MRIFKCILYCGFISIFIAPTILLAQEKRIYLAPDDHTDLFWLVNLDSYVPAFLEMLDYYIELAEDTQSEPDIHQSRWNCDGSYWMWAYEKNRSPEQFQKLINYMKSGHISVPLNPLAVVWGATPAEGVIRGMYYPGKIERAYNLRIPLAYNMENQSLPLGLSTLWREAGAKYSWKGVCDCYSMSGIDIVLRDHEIYWMEGNDGSRILMKWHTVFYGNFGPGGYAEARYPERVVDFVDSDELFKSRYPFPVIGAFGKGWDDLKTLTDEFVTVSKNKTNTSRSVIVSNEVDFFEDFEDNFGNDIPVVNESFGIDWELGAAAIQEVSSRLKRSIEKLRSAEAMSTYASLVDHSFMSGREESKDQAWMNMGMYFEHNLPMMNQSPAKVQERIDWQNELVDEVESYVDSIYEDAAEVIGNNIRSTGDNTRFFVFNPLSWSRTDFADFPYSGESGLKVIDLKTNLEVSSQIIQKDNQPFLRILAKDVPPVGYKVFEITTEKSILPSQQVLTDNTTLENDFYRIEIGQNGSIASIQSKKHNGKEFVKNFDNKLVNDPGGNGTESVEIINEGPVSATLSIRGSEPFSHTTQITLYSEVDRIDIHNAIEESFTTTESWSFGFDISDPEIFHEEVGTILKAKTKEKGGHYASLNASYDWLALNHFADIHNNELGVTLSNADCYFMKTGKSTNSYFDQSTSQISVLAGGRINNLGLTNQGGDSYFTQRFALRTHDTYTHLAAMQFSLEHQNPLIARKVTGTTKKLPEYYSSLLNVDNPNVLIWALKPSEEGPDNGYIVRLWSMSEDPEDYRMESDYAIRSAIGVSLIETPVKRVSLINQGIEDQVAPLGFDTYKFTLEPLNEDSQVVYNYVDASICDNEQYFAGGSYQSKSGTYYDTIQLDNNKDSIIVTNLEVFKTYHTFLDTTLCENDSIQLDSLYYSESGSYVIDIETSAGCDSTVTLTLDVKSCTTHYAELDDNNVIVFPNPSADKVYIQGSFDRFQLSSILGIALKEGDSEEIDISALPPGLYLLTVEHNNQALVKKIFKE